jgi:glycosyltransferase involved in cell wall biosynthesis
LGRRYGGGKLDKMERIRVLHSLDNSHLGGIQSMIFSLYNMSKHEHQFWAADGTMAEEMRAAGMRLWNRDSGDNPTPDDKFDVVIGHTVGGWSHHNLSGWAHDRGAKIVECMHSPAHSPTPPEDLDGFVAVGNSALSPNMHMPKAVCIYPPLDVGSFNQSIRGSAIGRMSRLVQEKRPIDFVILANNFRSEQFILAGDGNQFGYLRDQNIPNVAMIGWIRDFPRFYSTLKLFVFPTQDECNSMSVARALAAACPIICQDTGTLRETTGGFAWYARDIPEFSSRIQAFLDDPSSYQLVPQALQWVWDHYDKKVTIDNGWDPYLSDIAEG